MHSGQLPLPGSEMNVRWILRMKRESGFIDFSFLFFFFLEKS